MKPEINLPRVYSGKISLGKTMFPKAKVRSVTTAIVSSCPVAEKQKCEPFHTTTTTRTEETIY